MSKFEDDSLALFDAINDMGDIDKVQEILKGSELDLNTEIETGHYSTPLIFAIYQVPFRGKTDIVDLLLTYGADVNYVTKSGQTALMNSTMLGLTDIVRLHFKERGSVNSYSDTYSLITQKLFIQYS